MRVGTKTNACISFLSPSTSGLVTLCEPRLMNVKILFFASLREEVGCAELQLDVRHLSEVLPALQSKLPTSGYAALQAENVRIAVNQTMVEGDLQLKAGDEVAFLPPVTGG